MKKSIFITAVSGSGKYTVCRSLASLGHEAYDIESIHGLFSLVDTETGQSLAGKQIGDLHEDVEADWVCDLEKLKAIISNQENEVAFYCGGTSRTEELMKLFDTTIILQVSDHTTVERLSSRAQGEFGHKKEVRDWVLSWKHRVEAE